MTRTPTKDEIRDLYDNRIILTDSDTWNPEGLSSPCEIATVNIASNASALHCMKENVPLEGLWVCPTMERDAGYIAVGGNYILLSGVSTALTDETLLPCIIDSVNISNTTSKNQHCNISPKSLSEKLRIGLNTAQDTLKITTQQGI